MSRASGRWESEASGSYAAGASYAAGGLGCAPPEPLPDGQVASIVASARAAALGAPDSRRQRQDDDDVFPVCRSTHGQRYTAPPSPTPPPAKGLSLIHI